MSILDKENRFKRMTGRLFRNPQWSLFLFLIILSGISGCAIQGSEPVAVLGNSALVNKLGAKTLWVFGTNDIGNAIYVRKLKGFDGSIDPSEQAMKNFYGSVKPVPIFSLPEDTRPTINNRYLNGVAHGVVVKAGVYYLTDNKTWLLIPLGKERIIAVSLSPNQDAFIALDKQGKLSFFRHSKKVWAKMVGRADAVYLNYDVFLLRDEIRWRDGESRPYENLYRLGVQKPLAQATLSMICNNAKGLFVASPQFELRNVSNPRLQTGARTVIRLTMISRSFSLSDDAEKYEPDYLSDICSTPDSHYLAGKVKRYKKPGSKRNFGSASLFVYDLAHKQLVYQSKFTEWRLLHDQQFESLQIR